MLICYSLPDCPPGGCSPEMKAASKTRSPDGFHPDGCKIKKLDNQYLIAHFPGIGSDDPPPLPSPLGVENVKIRKNSEKIRGLPGVP